jgi:UDP-3-O-[3-hydroxymyristoyl] glucosamine N-acyltransferase
MKQDDLYISDDVQLGENVRFSKFINLYGCRIVDNTKIGAFVEIQKNATVGRNRRGYQLYRRKIRFR